MEPSTIYNFFTALATMGSLFVAYKLLQLNLQPEVIIYTHIDDRYPNVILLTIENIGNTIAYDISFNADKKIPKFSFGIERLNNPVEFFEDSIFQNGIKTFAPKEKRTFMWGQYGGLIESLEDGCINFTVKYYGQSAIKIPFTSKRKFTSEIDIDIHSFANTAANIDSIGENLEKIAYSMKTITRFIESIERKINK